MVHGCGAHWTRDKRLGLHTHLDAARGGLGCQKTGKTHGVQNTLRFGTHQYLEVRSRSKCFEVYLSPLKTIFIVTLGFFFVVKSGSQSIVQTSLKLRILLLQPPKCWVYWHPLPCYHASTNSSENHHSEQTFTKQTTHKAGMGVQNFLCSIWVMEKADWV